MALALSVPQLGYYSAGKSINLSTPLISVTTAQISAEPLATEADDEAFSESQSRAITLQALNPGYTIDGVQNVGEFIELKNSSASPVPLSGYALRYTNATGNRSNLYIFPEGSTMVGSTLLLRLASSPESNESDLTYTTTLALAAGPLELVYEDEVIDSACWTGKAECLPKFVNKDGQRTSLVKDEETGVFAHKQDYLPRYNPESPGYRAPESSSPEEEPVAPQCRGLEFSELYTYYESESSEQFIELYNSSDEPMMLDGCAIRYKNKIMPLGGHLDANSYYVYLPDFALTKNPSSSNSYELVDTTGDIIDALALPKGQKKSASYAHFGAGDNGEEWRITYARTPGEENVYQQFRSCLEGKIINPDTGNCVKAATIKEITDCPAGKYRNPTTGRCKSYETETTKECKEGYERNPETGRCRKIRNNDGADYPLVPKTASEKTTFVAFFAVLAVILAGIAYIIYQYRRELGQLLKKLLKLK